MAENFNESLQMNDEHDFRRYDQVWQRVLPTFNPWGADEIKITDITARPGFNLIPNPDFNSDFKPNFNPNPNPDLSSAEPEAFYTRNEQDPASADMDIIQDMIESELSQRGKLQALFQKAPIWARQNLRNLANHCAARARSLSAAYYLISGIIYEPTVRSDRINIGSWRPELRDAYQSISRAASRYARATEAFDICLARPMENLSASVRADAAELLRLLEKSIYFNPHNY